jgi:hypothetical protein
LDEHRLVHLPSWFVSRVTILRDSADDSLHTVQIGADTRNRSSRKE